MVGPGVEGTVDVDGAAGATGVSSTQGVAAETTSISGPIIGEKANAVAMRRSTRVWTKILFNLKTSFDVL